MYVESEEPHVNGGCEASAHFTAEENEVQRGASGLLGGGGSIPWALVCSYYVPSLQDGGDMGEVTACPANRPPTLLPRGQRVVERGTVLALTWGVNLILMASGMTSEKLPDTCASPSPHRVTVLSS